MRAPCLRRGHLMVAAAEIAWEAFVLAISLFFLAGQFALAVAGKGERVLRSSVSLQGPKKLSLACRSSSPEAISPRPLCTPTQRDMGAVRVRGAGLGTTTSVAANHSHLGLSPPP